MLLGDRPALTPAENLYQRMLAGDPDEALESAELLLKERSLTSYYDEVARQGLQLAANDAGRGVLTAHQLERVRDVVNALGMVITQTGLILGRRVDLRYGVNLTWGMVRAGSAANVIPSEGILRGTLRCADVRGWDAAGEMITGIIEQILAPLGVEAEVKRNRGLPPAVNAPGTTARIEAAARLVVGADNVVHTEQSMGGEDFAWFQQHVPGTLIRLGTRTPGGRTYDLHQGDARFDERAIAIGAQVLALTALAAERVKPQVALEVR